MHSSLTDHQCRGMSPSPRFGGQRQCTRPIDAKYIIKVRSCNVDITYLKVTPHTPILGNYWKLISDTAKILSVTDRC